jgi:hypothetical protein
MPLLEAPIVLKTLRSLGFSQFHLDLDFYAGKSPLSLAATITIFNRPTIFVTDA